MRIKEKIKNIYNDNDFDEIITMTNMISLPVCIFHNEKVKIGVFLYEQDFINGDFSCDAILVSSMDEEKFKILDDIEEISIYKDEILPLLPQHIPSKEFTLFDIQDRVYEDIEKMQYFCFQAKPNLSENEILIVKDYIMSLKAVVDSKLYDLYYNISPEFFEWMYLVVAE